MAKEKLFVNLHSIEPFPLLIQRPADLFLLTKERLECQTLVQLQLEQEDWNESDRKVCVSRLASLSDLLHNVSLRLSNWDQDSSSELLEQLATVLKNVRCFQFSVEEEHAGTSLLSGVSQLISGFYPVSPGHSLRIQPRRSQAEPLGKHAQPVRNAGNRQNDREA